MFNSLDSCTRSIMWFALTTTSNAVSQRINGLHYVVNAPAVYIVDNSKDLHPLFHIHFYDS